MKRPTWISTILIATLLAIPLLGGCAKVNQAEIQEQYEQLEQYASTQEQSNQKVNKEVKVSLVDAVIDTTISSIVDNTVGNITLDQEVTEEVSNEGVLEEAVKPTEQPNQPSQPEQTNKPSQPKQIDFTELKSKNEAIGAWLTIPALGINSPVINSTTLDDHDYYLNHNAYKKPSRAGAIFTDSTHNLNNLMNFRILLYGHNRPDGKEFGALKKLLDPKIQNTEGVKTIHLNTPEVNITYEIVSVFTINVASLENLNIINEDVELLYSFTSFAQLGKESFIETIRERNLVPKFDNQRIGINDQFLMLSTCHGKGYYDRLVVLAKATNYERK